MILCRTTFSTKPYFQVIAVTDVEIDRMVYELYGLTDDEIGIIEDSLS